MVSARLILVGMMLGVPVVEPQQASSSSDHGFVAGCVAAGGDRAWCCLLAEEDSLPAQQTAGETWSHDPTKTKKGHAQQQESGEPSRRRRLGSSSSSSSVTPRMGLFDLVGTLACLVTAALAAGLTMGVVSLDLFELRVVERTGTARDRKHARRLIPLLTRDPPHQVLVTLLLLNSAANEALPIFLDALVPSWAAVVASVTIVLFFGEIIPSAIFTGPKKLAIASYCAPIVSCSVYALWPLAWPLSKTLAKCLPGGESERKYTSRRELRALVDVQRADARSMGVAEPFSEDEADLITGAMTLSATSVADVMVPFDRVFSLNATDRLDYKAVQAIHDHGFSRIPVVEKDGDVRKYVLVKDLLLDIAKLKPFTPDSASTEGDDGFDDDNNKGPFLFVPPRVGELPTRAPVWITPTHSLFDLLNEFQTGSTHMAFVVEAPDGDDRASLHTSSLKKGGPDDALSGNHKKASQQQGGHHKGTTVAASSSSSCTDREEVKTDDAATPFLLRQSSRTAALAEAAGSSAAGSRLSASARSLIGLPETCTTTKPATKVVGILTLEDIIETILTEPIYDENDRANAAEVIRGFLVRHALPKVKKRASHTAPAGGVRASEDSFDDDGGHALDRALLSPRNSSVTEPTAATTATHHHTASPMHRSRGFSESASQSPKLPPTCGPPNATRRKQRRVPREARVASVDRAAVTRPRLLSRSDSHRVALENARSRLLSSANAAAAARPPPGAPPPPPPRSHDAADVV